MSEIRIRTSWFPAVFGILLLTIAAISLLMYLRKCIRCKKRLERLGAEDGKEGWNLTVLRRKVHETEHEKVEEIIKKAWGEEETVPNPGMERLK